MRTRRLYSPHTADEENKKFSQKEMDAANIKFGAAMNIIRVCVYDAGKDFCVMRIPLQRAGHCFIAPSSGERMGKKRIDGMFMCGQKQ